MERMEQRLSCGHLEWGKGHCADIACSNYIEKCPKHKTAGGRGVCNIWPRIIHAAELELGDQVNIPEHIVLSAPGIAEEALKAAARVVCDLLQAEDYFVTGDLAPDEVIAFEADLEKLVLRLAQNRATVGQP